MDQDEVEEEEELAEEMREEEASRSRPTSANCADPGARSGSMTDDDVANLKKKHQFLREFSDFFIKNTPVGDLMKIQSTSLKMKEFEKNKDVDDRLASNKADLASTFTELEAGKDNRWSSLHPGRFLPGAGCSAVRLWMEARNKLGTTGMLAIGSYDMAAAGLTGYVSAKGWTELHAISSQKISIKMFNNHSCGGKAKKGAASEEEEGHLDLAEFKLALRVLRTAVSFAMPWNYSVLALEGFLYQTDFCSMDLAAVEKKGLYLGKFVDFVLHQNGDRWRDSEPFYTVGELKTAWRGFFGSQPLAALANKPRKEQAAKKGPQKTSFMDNREARMALGICFAWNQGQCAKAAGACTTAKGKALKHVCDYNADRNKPSEVCGKEHMRNDFHK